MGTRPRQERISQICAFAGPWWAALLNKVSPTKAPPTLTKVKVKTKGKVKREEVRERTRTKHHHRVMEWGTLEGLRRQTAIVHKGGYAQPHHWLTIVEWVKQRVAQIE